MSKIWVIYRHIIPYINQHYGECKIEGITEYQSIDFWLYQYVEKEALRTNNNKNSRHCLDSFMLIINDF